MSNILLIEPDYRSKFPPLGLMRISTFHKELGDTVTFARGKVPALHNVHWHRIYISSLFTWELPRTLETIKYYVSAVKDPSDIVVGGIGVTLYPQFIRENVQCRIIEGPLNKPDMLDPGTPVIAKLVPDYSIIDSMFYKYRPDDSYFCRVTLGCIRRCKFCAVPLLEPIFEYFSNIGEQIHEIQARFGERQNLVLLDNNILAIDCFESIIENIRASGFEAGTKRNNRQRIVDFNQGIDARLITSKTAKLLSTICLSPVRLAFDFDAMEGPYRSAVVQLSKVGFKEFTTYIMYNYNDTPSSFYHRLKVNIELSKELGIRVTGFPMRYIPMSDISRQYVSTEWNWRYLRGIQCILHAVHGIVSPNSEFFSIAFGESYEEFVEIITMPDRYIIYRNHFKYLADDWRRLYRKLSSAEREDFLYVLAKLHKSKNRKSDMASYRQYKFLLEHYYPNGKMPRE
jgi:hypothetical protein